MKIKFEYAGRNYDQAVKFPDMVELPDDSDLQHLLDHLAALDCAKSIMPSCLISIENRHCGSISSHSNPRLSDGDSVLVLSPVAGG